jgi:hypothetical protein
MAARQSGLAGSTLESPARSRAHFVVVDLNGHRARQPYRATQSAFKRAVRDPPLAGAFVSRPLGAAGRSTMEAPARNSVALGAGRRRSGPREAAGRASHLLIALACRLICVTVDGRRSATSRAHAPGCLSATGGTGAGTKLILFVHRSPPAGKHAPNGRQPDKPAMDGRVRRGRRWLQSAGSGGSGPDSGHAS